MATIGDIVRQQIEVIAKQAEELAELRERAAQEVSCAQAQVSVHEEVL